MSFSSSLGEKALPTARKVKLFGAGILAGVAISNPIASAILSGIVVAGLVCIDKKEPEDGRT